MSRARRRWGESDAELAQAAGRHVAEQVRERRAQRQAAPVADQHATMREQLIAAGLLQPGRVDADEEPQP